MARRIEEDKGGQELCVVKRRIMGKFNQREGQEGRAEKGCGGVTKCV